MRGMLPAPMHDRHTGFVAAVVARDIVAEMARLLARRDIPLMPLKGVLLQQLVYDDPAERPLSDIDVLVPTGRYLEARQALGEVGYRLQGESRSLAECTLRAPAGMTVDFHGRLFSGGRYRMPTEVLFARAAVDARMFPGARVHVPDPYDLYAHLIGKLGSDHVDLGAEDRLREVAYVADRLGLDPGAAAATLARFGVARAARYALPLVDQATGGHAFSRDVLARLPRDARGDLIARTARQLVQRHGQVSFPGSVAGHLLNRSLPAAAGSLAQATLNRARWWRRRKHRRG